MNNIKILLTFLIMVAQNQLMAADANQATVHLANIDSGATQLLLKSGTTNTTIGQQQRVLIVVPAETSFKGKVKMQLYSGNSKLYERTESSSPYSLFGDGGGKYFPAQVVITDGTYRMVITLTEGKTVSTASATFTIATAVAQAPPIQDDLSPEVDPPTVTEGAGTATSNNSATEVYLVNTSNGQQQKILANTVNVTPFADGHRTLVVFNTDLQSPIKLQLLENNRMVVERTESAAPYSLFGDHSGTSFLSSATGIADGAYLFRYVAADGQMREVNFALQIDTQVAVEEIVPGTPDENPVDTTGNNGICRNARLWPFAAHSIWNRPIGSGASYIYAGLTSAGRIVADEEGLILAPKAPLTPVYYNGTGWNNTKEYRCSIGGELRATWPIPTAYVPDFSGTKPNASTAALMADGRTIKQTQPFARCTAGGHATSAYYWSQEIDLYGEFGDDVAGAHGGSGMSAIGGTIRGSELLPGGSINHAIKINLYAKKYLSYNNDSTRGYRWPAKRADGYASSTTYAGTLTALEMGALLALKPSFDVNSLKSEPGKILARALKNYGGYVVDDTAWDVFALNTAVEAVEMPDGSTKIVDVMDQFEREYGYDFEGQFNTTNPWFADIKTIFAELHVVDNNTSNTIFSGGGSTGLAPMAPEFCK